MDKIETNPPENPIFVASLSYGKDSMKMLDVIMEKGYPLDKVIHAQIMATPEISADLPPMQEFKAKADDTLLHRYGIKVEHYTSPYTFEDIFYRKIGKRGKPENQGKIKGFPRVFGSWCVTYLKESALKQIKIENRVDYIGYAIDENNPKRQEKIKNFLENPPSYFMYPLVTHNYTEQECFDWCKSNDLLSPIYESTTRGGCWFCPKQRIGQLRSLRSDYPDLWEKLLVWDTDNPWGDFNIRYTVAGLEERFAQEESQISLFDD